MSERHQRPAETVEEFKLRIAAMLRVRPEEIPSGLCRR